MKYYFDYSNELNNALDVFDDEIPKDYVGSVLYDINKNSTSKLFDLRKLELFHKMFELMNCAAKVTGASIEVSINENELVGQIILKCTDYYMMTAEDDIPRRAIMFALRHSDSVVIRNIKDKVVFDIMLKLNHIIDI